MKFIPRMLSINNNTFSYFNLVNFEIFPVQLTCFMSLALASSWLNVVGMCNNLSTILSLVSVDLEEENKHFKHEATIHPAKGEICRHFNS